MPHHPHVHAHRLLHEDSRAPCAQVPFASVASASLCIAARDLHVRPVRPLELVPPEPDSGWDMSVPAPRMALPPTPLPLPLPPPPHWLVRHAGLDESRPQTPQLIQQALRGVAPMGAANAQPQPAGEGSGAGAERLCCRGGGAGWRQQLARRRQRGSNTCCPRHPLALPLLPASAAHGFARASTARRRPWSVPIHHRVRPGWGALPRLRSRRSARRPRRSSAHQLDWLTTLVRSIWRSVDRRMHPRAKLRAAMAQLARLAEWYMAVLPEALTYVSFAAPAASVPAHFPEFPHLPGRRRKQPGAGAPRPQNSQRSPQMDADAPREEQPSGALIQSPPPPPPRPPAARRVRLRCSARARAPRAFQHVSCASANPRFFLIQRHLTAMQERRERLKQRVLRAAPLRRAASALPVLVAHSIEVELEDGPEDLMSVVSSLRGLVGYEAEFIPTPASSPPPCFVSVASRDAEAKSASAEVKTLQSSSTAATAPRSGIPSPHSFHNLRLRKLEAVTSSSPDRAVPTVPVSVTTQTVRFEIGGESVDHAEKTSVKNIQTSEDIETALPVLGALLLIAPTAAASQSSNDTTSTGARLLLNSAFHSQLFSGLLLNKNASSSVTPEPNTGSSQKASTIIPPNIDQSSTISSVYTETSSKIPSFTLCTDLYGFNIPVLVKDIKNSNNITLNSGEGNSGVCIKKSHTFHNNNGFPPPEEVKELSQNHPSNISVGFASTAKGHTFEECSTCKSGRDASPSHFKDGADTSCWRPLILVNLPCLKSLNPLPFASTTIDNIRSQYIESVSLVSQSLSLVRGNTEKVSTNSDEPSMLNIEVPEASLSNASFKSSNSWGGKQPYHFKRIRLPPKTNSPVLYSRVCLSSPLPSKHKLKPTTHGWKKTPSAETSIYYPPSVRESFSSNVKELGISNFLSKQSYRISSYKSSLCHTMITRATSSRVSLPKRITFTRARRHKHSFTIPEIQSYRGVLCSKNIPQNTGDGKRKTPRKHRSQRELSHVLGLPESTTSCRPSSSEVVFSRTKSVISGDDYSSSPKSASRITSQMMSFPPSSSASSGSNCKMQETTLYSVSTLNAGNRSMRFNLEAVDKKYFASKNSRKSAKLLKLTESSSILTSSRPISTTIPITSAPVLLPCSRGNDSSNNTISHSTTLSKKIDTQLYLSRTQSRNLSPWMSTVNSFYQMNHSKRISSLSSPHFFSSQLPPSCRPFLYRQSSYQLPHQCLNHSQNQSPHQSPYQCTYQSPHPSQQPSSEHSPNQSPFTSSNSSPCLSAHHSPCQTPCLRSPSSSSVMLESSVLFKSCSKYSPHEHVKLTMNKEVATSATKLCCRLDETSKVIESTISDFACNTTNRKHSESCKENVARISISNIYDSDNSSQLYSKTLKTITLPRVPIDMSISTPIPAPEPLNRASSTNCKSLPNRKIRSLLRSSASSAMIHKPVTRVYSEQQLHGNLITSSEIQNGMSETILKTIMPKTKRVSSAFSTTLLHSLDPKESQVLDKPEKISVQATLPSDVSKNSRRVKAMSTIKSYSEKFQQSNVSSKQANTHPLETNSSTKSTGSSRELPRSRKSEGTLLSAREPSSVRATDSVLASPRCKMTVSSRHFEAAQCTKTVGWHGDRPTLAPAQTDFSALVRCLQRHGELLGKAAARRGLLLRCHASPASPSAHGDPCAGAGGGSFISYKEYLRSLRRHRELVLHVYRSGAPPSPLALGDAVPKPVVAPDTFGL